MLASGSGHQPAGDPRPAARGEDGIEVVGVGSDKPDATALERARAAGVETAVFPAADYEDRARARRRRSATGSRDRRSTWSCWPATCSCSRRSSSTRFAQPGDQRPSRAAARPSPGIDAVQQALDHGVEDHRGDRPLRRRGGRLGADHPAAAGAGRRRAATGRRPRRRSTRTEHALLPETIRLIAAGRVRVDDAATRASSTSTRVAGLTSLAGPSLARRRLALRVDALLRDRSRAGRRVAAGAPGADLGRRQDRGRGVRRRAGEAGGRDRSRPAGRSRCCARRGSMRGRSRT